MLNSLKNLTVSEILKSESGYFKPIFQSLIAVFTLVSAYLVYRLISDKDENNLSNALMLLVSLILLVVSFIVYKAKLKKQKADTDEPENAQYNAEINALFYYGIRVSSILLLVLGGIGIVVLLGDKQDEAAIFKAIGLGIVTIWGCIFLTYFIWAVYFYNVNFGVTDRDWEVFYAERRKQKDGLEFSQEIIDEEPKYNPYREETFGLPGGTVRGMIAFTLLFGALAMLVVSMGLENKIDSSSFLWDHYEFFKTAFLMMIAFYFGSRSLQYLSKRGNAANQGGEDKSPADKTENKGLNKVKKILSSDDDTEEDPEKPKPEPKEGDVIGDEASYEADDLASYLVGDTGPEEDEEGQKPTGGTTHTGC